MAALTAVVQGRVQGVCFRAFVLARARELNLCGSVRNNPDGQSVRVVAEGARTDLESLVPQLKAGPPAARVTAVTINWSEYRGECLNFSVRYA